jgi:hypothetical protein
MPWPVAGAEIDDSLLRRLWTNVRRLALGVEPGEELEELPAAATVQVKL